MIIRPAQPIATQNKASTDRRAIFVSLSNESGEVDLLLAQRNQRFGQLRTIYIDTSAQDDTGNGCVIETDIGQKITALANTQGYYPVFVPFVTKLTISSNQAVTLLMLDFDMRPVTWPTALQLGSVPNPLHVIIDDQPVATLADVQNWPASQPVTIQGQPIATNAAVQNWPVKTNEGLALGFAFISANGNFPVSIGPNAIPVNAITSLNVFGINYTNTAGPQIELFLGAIQVPGRFAVPFSVSAISGLFIDNNGLNLNVGSVQSSISANVIGGGTWGGSLLLQIAYR